MFESVCHHALWLQSTFKSGVQHTMYECCTQVVWPVGPQCIAQRGGPKGASVVKFQSIRFCNSVYRK